MIGNTWVQQIDNKDYKFDHDTKRKTFKYFILSSSETRPNWELYC